MLLRTTHGAPFRYPGTQVSTWKCQVSIPRILYTYLTRVGQNYEYLHRCLGQPPVFGTRRTRAIPVAQARSPTQLPGYISNTSRVPDWYQSQGTPGTIGLALSGGSTANPLEFRLQPAS